MMTTLQRIDRLEARQRPQPLLELHLERFTPAERIEWDEYERRVIGPDGKFNHRRLTPAERERVATLMRKVATPVKRQPRTTG